MRILTRYILREIVSYALLGGVLFTFVLFVAKDLGHLLELIIRNTGSMGTVLRIVLYTIPNTLVLPCLWQCWLGCCSALAGWRPTVKSRPCGPQA